MDIAAAVLLALFALAPFLAEVWGGGYVLSLIMRVMILAIVALSLDLLIGQAGLVSFGHAAFVGLGAYVTGICITEGVTDAATILALVVLGAAVFALVTGAAALRTTGVYFIMITLAFGQMLFFALSSLSRYGGDDGLTLWERADAFGTGVLERDGSLYYVIFTVLVLSVVFFARIAQSRFGRVLRAAKEAPVRVAAMGYNVFAYRLTAYVIAGVVAAIGGFLLANQAEFVSPAAAAWQRSGDFIIMVVLGGMGSRHGALFGAVAVALLEEFLSSLLLDWRLIFGPMLVIFVLYAKGGIASLIGTGARRDV